MGGSSLSRTPAWLPPLATMRWLLVCGLLPSLSFFGHWTIHVDIPGTDMYVGLPAPSEAEGHDHIQHCHADAASCSDTPLTTTASVATLAEVVSSAGADSPLIGLEAPGATGTPQAQVGPVSPPPRSLSLA